MRRPDGRIAQYSLGELIARGGMSSVYRAHDDRLGRDVALKLLSADLSEDAAFRSRFEREWQTAAALRHPNILPIFDAGEWNGQLYIAMLLVEGPDLGALIKQSGPLPTARAVAILNQLASALDAAHATGIVHRDIKPANVLLVPGNQSGEPDHVYLADFGLTRPTNAMTRMTRSGEIMATIAYIAPELLQGKPADQRTDEYSLGCVAFETLTGRPPFPHETEAAALTAHLVEPVPHISPERPDVPVAIDGVMAVALAKAPEQRFQSCGAFAQAFAAGMQGRGVAAPTRQPGALGAESFDPYAQTRAVPAWQTTRPLAQPEPPPAATRGSGRRLVAVALVLVIVVLAAVGGGIVGGLFSGSPPTGSVKPVGAGQASGAPSPRSAAPSGPNQSVAAGTSSPAGSVFVPPSLPRPSSQLGQPVTGSINLTGQVATQPPGTFVASGAAVSSALHPGERAREFYSVQLDSGQILGLTVGVDCCPNLLIGIATPTALDVTSPNDIEWSSFSGDPVSDDGGTWIAVEPGIYTVVVDDEDDSSSPPTPYVATFSINGQRSDAPADGQPVSGSVNLTGHVATSPPGTLVVSGAAIRSALHPDEHATDYYSVQLGAGQVLTLAVGFDCCPNVEAGIATPAALAASSDPDEIDWSSFAGDPFSDEGGTWTVVTSGSYTVYVTDHEDSTSSPVAYDASFTIR